LFACLIERLKQLKTYQIIDGSRAKAGIRLLYRHNEKFSRDRNYKYRLRL